MKRFRFGLLILALAAASVGVALVIPAGGRLCRNQSKGSGMSRHAAFAPVASLIVGGFRGLLQVGPHSAGAVPSPLAYGRGGTEPTTTDAALVPGYMDPTGFLSGAMPLDIEASRAGTRSRLALDTFRARA